MHRVSKAQVLAAAVVFVDKNGLHELSMRRLAAQLGVGTMTLYNHGPNKDPLLIGIVQTILEEIEIPGPDVKPWSEKCGSYCGRSAKKRTDIPRWSSSSRSIPHGHHRRGVR